MSPRQDVSPVELQRQLLESFEFLQGGNGARDISLRVQLRKCAVSGGSKKAVALVAVELHIGHCPEGVTVCGTPIDTESYFTSSLLGSACNVVDQITKLVNLPLAKESQFSLLRHSLSLRTFHLRRSLP